MGNLKFILSNKYPRIFFVLGFALFLITAFYNVGIIALDDYAFVVAQVIPAQRVNAADILANKGLWMPLHPWLLHEVSSFAYRLGVTDPYVQLQWVLVCIALITFPILSILSVGFFETTKQKTTALFLVCFYFACPLFFTRPMIETMCAPFLFLSCYLAMRYWNDGLAKNLIGAVVALTVASVFRSQAGVCIFAIIFVVGARRKLKDFLVLFVTGVICFMASGYLDKLLTGGFHLSLKGYLNYNLNYGATNHGHQPFYVFASLFVALTIPPVFFSKYSQFKWKAEYRRLLPLISYFVVFLVAHSLFPHKEERFMIPVLAVFLMLLVPLADYLTLDGLYTWRPMVFLGVNFLILPLASFNIPQKNILGVVRYLHHHENIHKIAGIEETLVVYPEAFSNRQVPDSKIRTAGLGVLSKFDCGTALAVREDYQTVVAPYLGGFEEAGHFAPGFVEKLFVVLNPKYNSRRGMIRLYEKKECKP